tara:strand:+ start:660 stop:1028 length:369 start_codon:yes stop_codon:yes gene_type:complete
MNKENSTMQTVKELNEGRGDWMVHCPVDDCSQPHLVHPTNVYVVTGDQTTNISEHGTMCFPTESIEGRGVITELHYICETGGHKFSVNQQFHKGSTEINIKRFDDAEESADGGIDYQTIWRN